MREHQLTLLVLGILYVNLYNVTCLQVGIVTELRSGDDTIALVAEVNNDFILVDADDGSINNLVLAYFVQRLIIRFVKLFLADVGHGAILELIPVEVL